MTKPELDYQLLDKELDRTKSKVFLSKNAGFLAPLMSSMNFTWAEDISTACTNGISLKWNPHWFLELPKATRGTVLMHELWHPALLHMLRRGTRDPRVWNWACDIYINNMLYHQGYTFDGTTPWLDDSINRWKHPLWVPIGNYGEMPAEEVYEKLLQLPQLQQNTMFVWGHEEEDGEGDEGDIVEPGEEGEDASTTKARILNKVVAAQTADKLAGMGSPGAGLPAEIDTILKRFLKPKLPWEQLLMQFCIELGGQDFTWALPDRRFRDMYLPSLQDEEDGLAHLMYFLDQSGSVSNSDIIRFNSEVKYIWETLQPKKLTIVLFDDCIQEVIVFEDQDSFDEIIVKGRGGTDLAPVREYILEHKPTAVVVFSDLLCRPMDPYPKGVDIPTIFVGVNARPNSEVLFGKLIHIRE